MKNETKLNSVQRPNRDSQFDDLNRSTLHRQVTVQSPQPNSPAKKPAVICINVIILHSSASNVLHQYFSDQNPQSVSDFFYLLKVDEVRRYLWIHQFSKIPQKKFDRFLPWKFIQTKYIGILCTHLSRFALRIIKTNHMYLVFNPYRAEIYQKIFGGILETQWFHKYILTSSDLLLLSKHAQDLKSL